MSKKSSVKLFQENPEKYELNTKMNGPTYIPKPQQPVDNSQQDSYRGDVDRGHDSPWQDWAEDSDDF